MKILSRFERSPSLAELKVTYRRSRRRGDAPVLTNPVECEAFLRSVWDKDTFDLRESVVVVCLTQALEVIGWVRVSEGGIASAPVDPRIVFGVALAAGSAGIVLAHNHPAGSVTPSPEDIRLTRQIADGAALLRIRFVDHVILGRDGAYSFADSGALAAA